MTDTATIDKQAYLMAKVIMGSNGSIICGIYVKKDDTIQVCRHNPSLQVIV